MNRTVLVAAADLHLGGPVASPPGAPEGLAEGSRRGALLRLVELTRRENAAAVLLAGDVFHTPRPPLTALLALEQALDAWREMGVPVFVTPGNHDPLLSGSAWAGLQNRPGLTVFGPQGGGAELPGGGVWVAGAGHGREGETADLSPRVPPPPPGLTGLGMLHCQVTGSRGAADHQPYAPSSLSSLAASPQSAWVLGHVHQPQELCSAPLTLYTGCLQGAHWGEAGPRGVWVLRVEAGGVRGDFVPLAPLTFHDLRLDGLGGVESPAALARRVAEGLGGADGTARFLRLALCGPSPLFGLLREGRETGFRGSETSLELARLLEVESLVLDTAALLPPLDPEELARGGDVLGRMLRLLDQAGEGDLLEGLAGELAGSFHPLGRGDDADAVRRRLSGLLEEVRALALGDLWRGGSDDS